MKTGNKVTLAINYRHHQKWIKMTFSNLKATKGQGAGGHCYPYMTIMPF